MTFSRTQIAEDREKLSAYYQDQGYAYANVLPLTKVDLAEPQDQPDLRGRARQARLLRAHQHPRQLEDARQGDPPRDEDLRGRAVQQHQPRDLEAPHQRARLLRERRGLDQARQLRRVRRGQRRGHRAADRHVPDRRRLLVGRELHRAGADLAEQPVRPRPDARAAGPAVEPAPAVPAALRRAVLPRHASGRSRSTSTTRAAASARSSATRPVAR